MAIYTITPILKSGYESRVTTITNATWDSETQLLTFTFFKVIQPPNLSALYWIGIANAETDPNYQMDADVGLTAVTANTVSNLNCIRPTSYGKTQTLSVTFAPGNYAIYQITRGGSQVYAEEGYDITIPNPNSAPTAIPLENAIAGVKLVRLVPDQTTDYDLGQLTVTDPDEGDTHTLAITSQTDSASAAVTLFSIDSDEHLTLSASATAGTYTVQITATDSGSETYTATLTIVVGGSNDLLTRAVTGTLLSGASVSYSNGVLSATGLTLPLNYSTGGDVAQVVRASVWATSMTDCGLAYNALSGCTQDGSGNVTALADSTITPGRWYYYVISVTDGSVLASMVVDLPGSAVLPGPGTAPGTNYTYTPSLVTVPDQTYYTAGVWTSAAVAYSKTTGLTASGLALASSGVRLYRTPGYSVNPIDTTTIKDLTSSLVIETVDGVETITGFTDSDTSIDSRYYQFFTTTPFIPVAVRGVNLAEDNLAPTAIALSGSLSGNIRKIRMITNQATSYDLGQLSVTDPNTTDTATLAITTQTDSNSESVSLFSIDANEHLTMSASATAGTWSVVVTATDAAGATCSQTFTVVVLPVIQPLTTFQAGMEFQIGVSCEFKTWGQFPDGTIIVWQRTNQNPTSGSVTWSPRSTTTIHND